MAILKYNVTFPGQIDVIPRFGHLYVNDPLATVTTAGYLTNYITTQGISVKPTDIIFCVAADGTQIYKPVFNAGIITLTVLP